MRNKFIFLLAITITGCFSKDPEKTGLEGDPLPSFKLFLVDSVTKFDTKNIPNDKPIVLLYFGPHCPYSKAQIQEIVDNNLLLKNIRFYLFTTWSFAELKKIYYQYELEKYTNIKVGVDYTSFFVNYISAPGVPYMAIYGKNKRLKHAFIGKISSTQIKSVALN